MRLYVFCTLLFVMLCSFGVLGGKFNRQTSGSVGGKFNRQTSGSVLPKTQPPRSHNKKVVMEQFRNIKTPDDLIRLMSSTQKKVGARPNTDLSLSTLSLRLSSVIGQDNTCSCEPRESNYTLPTGSAYIMFYPHCVKRFVCGGCCQYNQECKPTAFRSEYVNVVELNFEGFEPVFSQKLIEVKNAQSCACGSTSK